MQKNNYFIEGLQGAGKSTFVQRLSEFLTDYKVFREGDYSPVELAWCAYVTAEQYHNVLKDYPMLREEIKEKTIVEGDRSIICYTQILTDVPNFHKNLEKFEIYNGSLDRESFENVILGRFQKWNGEGQIFECSVFQNIIENQMLYLMMTDEDIMNFYRRLKDILADKTFKIIYLDVEDIPGAIDVIRKERSDDEGNELWFPMMIRYLEESPYGKEHALTGMEGLVTHLERRRNLERRIVREIFEENTITVKAKHYIWEDISNSLVRSAYFMKIIRVVAAIICDDMEKPSRIFATAKGYGEFKGQWEFPGGKIEAGELPEEALVREIREELDTDIEVGRLIHTIEYDYPAFHLSMRCFLAHVNSGRLVLKEAEAARWLTKGELYDVQWLPADLSLIEMLEGIMV